MKLKHVLLLAISLAIATTGSKLLAQDSSTTQPATTTTTETASDDSPKVDYMKIYAWVGGIIITIVAVVVITIEFRSIKDDDSPTTVEDPHIPDPEA